MPTGRRAGRPAPSSVLTDFGPQEGAPAGRGGISTWVFELGINPSWPEWFKEYRRGADAELHEKVDTCTSGRMTDREFKTWALESSQRQAEWLNTLAPERRAWIKEQERDEQFAALADARKITLVEFLAELGQDR